MANTYTLISSVTVGTGGASSIDFTSIPSTYTDLILKVCARTDYASVNDALNIKLNGSTSNFTFKQLYGNGASAASNGGAANVGPNSNGGTSTANTFGNGEIYIPNYAGSAYKSISIDGVGETNGTTAYAGLAADLWSIGSAINQITLVSSNAANIVQYSTAYLYGVNNA
jgi:hypothetical protein